MKFKIKTNLRSDIIMGVFGAVILFVMPDQVRLPVFDSGTSNPRTIPGIYLARTLICSMTLLIESLVFKKEKGTEFGWAKERPCIFLTVLFCAFMALIIDIGFIPGVVIISPIMLWYCSERKPFIYIFTLTAGVGIFSLFKYVFHILLPGISGFRGR